MNMYFLSHDIWCILYLVLTYIYGNNHFIFYIARFPKGHYNSCEAQSFKATLHIIFHNALGGPTPYENEI